MIQVFILEVIFIIWSQGSLKFFACYYLFMYFIIIFIFIIIIFSSKFLLMPVAMSS